MDVSGVFADDSAVSPVIGVTLLVAIAVALAAVAAVLFLGLGETDDPAPTTTFEVTSAENTTVGQLDRGEVTLSVQSGDTFAADDVIVTGEGQLNGNTGVGGPSEDSLEVFDDATLADISTGSSNQDIKLDGEEIEPGDRVTAGSDIDFFFAAEGAVTITLVWAPEGDGESILFEEEIDIR